MKSWGLQLLSRVRQLELNLAAKRVMVHVGAGSGDEVSSSLRDH